MLYETDDGEVELDARTVRRYLEQKRKREKQNLWVPERLWYADPTGNRAVRNLEPWFATKKKTDALQEQNAGSLPLETSD